HPSLALYPSIESCLLALIAYTCYFLSNGLSMSGIVSLPFCGITLNHYAYHTMSRRTQRTSKYMFAILAQLTENFLFIYLGLSLFTSPPSGSKVTSYFKPLFIVITTICVIVARYASVFPLSQAINFFQRHARGQRTEELPYAYQMMLFWAGLRGAVGVALAAGFRGDNAEILRTTVLVVVVLTVVMFGGTTSRMLEILGIRTGVDDEGGSSSDEEDAVAAIAAGGPSRGGGWLGRRTNWRAGYTDEEERYAQGRARIGAHYMPQSYNHQAQAAGSGSGGHAMNNIFSAASSDSLESDSGEVLPMATPPHTPGIGHNSTRRSSIPGPGSGAVGEDGKWFQALDERYLIPLFSNATASRTFHARRARRTASGGNSPLAGVSASASGSEVGTPVESDDDVGGGEGEGRKEGDGGRSPWTSSRPQLTRIASIDVSRLERGLASPVLRGSRDAL
ncbi:hypothetical protein BD410DRAFT_796671, partial [Rickenella mellea]